MGKRAKLLGILVGWACAHVLSWLLFDTYRYLPAMLVPRGLVLWIALALGKNQIEDLPDVGAEIWFVAGFPFLVAPLCLLSSWLLLRRTASSALWR